MGQVERFTTLRLKDDPVPEPSNEIVVTLGVHPKVRDVFFLTIPTLRSVRVISVEEPPA